MLRGDLITRVARKTSLDSTTGSEDYNLIAAMLNEAIVEILLRTHIYIQQVEVNPTPDTGESLRFWAVLQPQPMNNDSNDPADPTYGGIPTPHRAIEYYALWQLAEDVEKVIPYGPKDYHDQFVSECSLMSKRKHHMGGRQLAPATIGYPTSRRVPLRNDVYPEQQRR